MERRKLTQTDVATFAGWSQSKTSKVLHGKIDISLTDVEVLANAVSLSLVEVVRDHGMEFCAEMTPSELTALKNLRDCPPRKREAFLTLLEATAAEARHAAPRRPLHGKPRPR